jgi:PhnB protein
MRGETKMTTTLIQPYLFFGGRCEEALEYYRTALGAQVDRVMYFKDSPEPPSPGVLQPGFESKVMHSSFRVGANTILASDGCNDKSSFSGFSLTLSVPTEADADRAFDALARGRSRCRSPGRSGRRDTAWSPTASASPGW